MKIFNLILSVLFISAVAVSCNPMDDINDTLEDEYTGPVFTDLEYTLSDADYVTISQTASEEAETPEDYDIAQAVADDTTLFEGLSTQYIPELLNDNADFLGYGAGSTITVTYNYAENVGDTAKVVTETFIVTENLIWAAPSVLAFDFTSTDYLMLTNYVKEDPTLGVYWEDEYSGREVYYGSSPSYANFDMRYSTRCFLDDDRDVELDPEIVALYDEALISGDYTDLDNKLNERGIEAMELMMQFKYAESGATIEANGSTITYRARSLFFLDGFVDQYVVCVFECTKASPNATFELKEVIYE